jgi:hypothetical protein
MAFSTEDFPQADKLDQVGMVAQAVSKGHRSFDAIEDFIGLESEGRQGRYYRKAAELLGLVTNRANRATLTDRGAEYVKLSTREERRAFLAHCLSENELFKAVTKYVADHRPTQSQLSSHIVSIYPGAENTARRRVSSVMAFLTDSGLAVSRGGRYVPGASGGGPLIEETEDEEGLYGKPVETNPGTGQPVVREGTYTVEVDAAKQERANFTHKRLVTGKAVFLKSRDLPANSNKSIDLYSKSGAATVLYEMKSLDAGNFVAQVRRAISQLYEYRYAFRAPEARLCVVTSGYPEKRSKYYLKYLQEDRQIAYVWTEDFEAFQCEAPSKALLGPFSP